MWSWSLEFWGLVMGGSGSGGGWPTLGSCVGVGLSPPSSSRAVCGVSPRSWVRAAATANWRRIDSSSPRSSASSSSSSALVGVGVGLGWVRAALGGLVARLRCTGGPAASPPLLSGPPVGSRGMTPSMRSSAISVPDRTSGKAWVHSRLVARAISLSAGYLPRSMPARRAWSAVNWARCFWPVSLRTPSMTHRVSVDSNGEGVSGLDDAAAHEVGVEPDAAVDDVDGAQRVEGVEAEFLAFHDGGGDVGLAADHFFGDEGGFAEGFGDAVDVAEFFGPAFEVDPRGAGGRGVEVGEWFDVSQVRRRNRMVLGSG